MAYKNKEDQLRYNREYRRKRYKEDKEYRKKTLEYNKNAKLEYSKTEEWKEKRRTYERNRWVKDDTYREKKKLVGRTWKQNEYKNNPDYKAKVLEDTKEYKRKRRMIDEDFRFIENSRHRTNQALNGIDKSASTKELLGGTMEEIWAHLEPQFYGNLTKENYGTVWQAHHVKECNSFDLSKPEQQRECFNYTNLQPLTIEDHKLLHSGKLY